MENAIIQGDFITNKLEKNLEEYKIVKKIRHIGLMIGIELYVPCNELIQMALDEKLLNKCNCGQCDSVIATTYY